MKIFDKYSKAVIIKEDCVNLCDIDINGKLLECRVINMNNIDDIEENEIKAYIIDIINKKANLSNVATKKILRVSMPSNIQKLKDATFRANKSLEEKGLYLKGEKEKYMIEKAIDLLFVYPELIQLIGKDKLDSLMNKEVQIFQI